MLDATLEHTQPSGWRTTEPPDTADGITTAWIAFETAAGRGNGLLRLRDGKAWTLLTALYELKGFEEPKGTHRPKGVSPRRRPRPRDLARGPPAGGGGARLLGRPRGRDRRRRPGRDRAWARACASSACRRSSASATRARATPGAKRYKSLCLHDPVWYDHLPYITFPENWPVFSPKDKIGDWLEMYARVMELNYWGSTTVQSGELRPRRGALDRAGRARRPGDHAPARASSCSPPAWPRSRTSRRSRG